MVVPNAQRGKARRSPSRLLRNRYGIDASQRIVLCTGYLRPWAMSLEIVEAARAWPAEYVLYVQSKVVPEGDDESPYSDAVIRAAESRNVIIGLDPVPADQFQELVDAADVGIAMYNPLSRGDGPVDRNMELMGYSSGKLADYLHAGLPVIVNRLPGPRDLVEGHKCGICVDGAGELAGALDVIFRDYGRFSSNACRCFDEVLDLDRSFPSVLARLEELEPETSSELPRISFGIIVLNGEPFTRYCLRSLYPFAHEIIVVEGGHEDTRAVTTHDGHSTDGTLETLRRFVSEEDPEKKVRIVTRDGFWPKRDELGHVRTAQSRAYTGARNRRLPVASGHRRVLPSTRHDGGPGDSPQPAVCNRGLVSSSELLRGHRLPCRRMVLHALRSRWCPQGVQVGPGLPVCDS